MTREEYEKLIDEGYPDDLIQAIANGRSNHIDFLTYIN